MENTGLERTDRQGVAGTEWRMQVGGERLGRVGIAVAGQERRAMARFGVARRRLAGMEKPVKARGMEGSGTVGIMEAWQAWRVQVGCEVDGSGGNGKAGTETQARYDKARSGGHGLEPRDRARKCRRGASRQRGERQCRES